MIMQKEYSYSELTKTMFMLAEKYDFVQLYSIGKSVLGRQIYAFEIGVDEQKVLYTGGFHGSERLTTLTLLIFMDKLCMALSENADFSDCNARKALFGKSLIIVPCVNPDGYEIALNGASTSGTHADKVREIAADTDFKHWNANARGVDINHNFDAGFDILKALEEKEGITKPSPRKYGGTHPESEPESKAVADLCRCNDILHMLCFHSQGEEIYWHYGDNTPPKGERLARLFAISSGYALSHPTSTASHGGFKDWFIKEYSRPGFTVELGLGENPLDPKMLYDIYGRIEEMLLLSIVM